jgi:arylsulfatase A-like enzyme/Tfp pilus assembly protein PilF
VRVGAATIVAALLTVACGRDRVLPAHSGLYRDAPVVLISIDTLRADHLALYGYGSGATPVLDRLGREAIVLEDLYSHCPLTLPSHASLMTGLLPVHHGVHDNLGYALGAGQETLASRFKAAGYVTGGAVSAYVLRRQTGIGQGFDFFDDAIEVAGTGESLSDSQRDGARTVDALADWVDRQSTTRLFAFLHLYEPHTPYAPPPSHRLANAYDGEIAYADELVGRFLARLAGRRLLDRAVVAVVSDHGEGLNDHGESEHGIFLYREALHVPGLLALPGRASAGTRVRGTLGIIDVTATLLEIAGLSSQGIDGRSIAAALGATRIVDRSVYAETQYPRLHFGWSDLASAVEGRYHYIRAPRPELFDVSVDPQERANIASTRATTASALRTWVERTSAASTGGDPADVPADVRERLKALGYVGSSPAPAAGASPPDPKDTIGTYEALKHALALAAQGRDEDAIAALEPLTSENPRLLDGWEALAKSLERTGRTKEAIAVFGKVLELSPLKPETHLALARIYALEREPDKARAHAELAARRDPAAAFEVLAELAMDAGRTDEAASFARRSIDADPSRYMSHFLLGVVAQRRGRCDAAITAYERAIDAKRTDPHAVVRNLHAGLADCLARVGRTADAEREFKAELAAVRSSPEARVGLATLYRSQGRDREAREVLAGLVDNTPQADAATYLTVVRAFRVLGDEHAAREWAARARARFPRDPRFR